MDELKAGDTARFLGVLWPNTAQDIKVVSVEKRGKYTILLNYSYVSEPTVISRKTRHSVSEEIELISRG